MTALEKIEAIDNRNIEAKRVASDSQTYEAMVTDFAGKQRKIYFHSGAWHDRPFNKNVILYGRA